MYAKKAFCFCCCLIIASLACTQDTAAFRGYVEQSTRYAETQPDSAVSLCSKAMKLAQEGNNLKGQALVLLQLGKINYLHHHAELARKFINEAMSISRNLRDQQGMAAAYDELGLVDGVERNLPSATADFRQSLSYYENKRDSMGIARTYYAEGKALEEGGNLEKALSCYLQALHYYERLSKKDDDYFTLLQSISRLYTKKGERLSALHYLEEGTQHIDQPVFADTQFNMLEEEGRIEEAAGDNVRAMQQYKHELELARQANNPEAQARALANIAGLLMKQDAGGSLVYLKEALGIAQKLPHAQLKASIYQAMAGAYRQQKNYKEAMLVLAEHNRLLDSLLAASTNSEIAALDSSYVIESKEEELDKLKTVNRREKIEIDLGLVALVVVLAAAALLWLYLRKMNRLNQKLQKSNQIRDTLFSIIGHDLKGPAGNTVQLFEMMDAGELPEKLQKELLGELKIQAIASFDLLNDLFAWGKAQLHGVEVKAAEFEIMTPVQKGINLLRQQATAKNITVTSDVTAGTQVYADPHHIEFIIRNLLSNAIKFTQEGGSIAINAIANEGKVTCSVKDDGIGISREKQLAFQKTTLPVSFGTKGEKGSGLGLLLIKEFVLANKGRIWLESEEGKGSTFYFSLPENTKPDENKE